MDRVRRSVVIGLINAEKTGYSNLLLKGVLHGAGEEERSRAFAAYLFYGVVERQYTLDAALAPFLKKPIGKMDAEVRAILRSGLYQIFYMDGVPARAAVNEAVELCRAMGKSSAAGFVNAVLRRAGEAGVPQNFPSEQERLSVLYSISPAIAGLLFSQYGAEAEEILAASFLRPKVAVRVNTLKITPPQLTARFKAEGVSAEPGRVANSLFLNAPGDITALPSFQEGLFHVQGEASQYCALSAGPKPGEKAVDLCCAPGGKSATMGQLMENSGVLFCRDVSAGRLKLAEELLGRCGVTIAHFLAKGAEKPDPSLENAQVVLCDAPCSGLGTLSKKPDIRTKTLSDIQTLYKEQRAILQTAAAYPVVGGRLVYSTCTINQKENENVVEDFLGRNKNYRMKPLAPPFENALDTGFGTLLLPNRTGTDGFFIACLERLW